MKKILWLLTLVFCLTAWPVFAAQVDLGGTQPLAIQVLEADGSHVTVAIEIGSFKLTPKKTEDGDRYWRINLAGAGTDPVIGEPELPVVTRFVQVPAQGGATMQIVSATYTNVDLGQYGDYQIWPVQAPVDKLPGALEAASFAINQASYERAGFSGPGTGLSDLGVIRGMRFVPLTVAPITYDPVKNVLRVATKMVVRVNFERAAAKVGAWTDSTLRQPAFDALANDLFINHVALTTAAKVDPYVPANTVPGGYLIIAAPAFVDNADLLALAAWKAQKGFQVTLVSTDDTGTTTDAIEAYITDAYNNWEIPPTYVLFVGDTDTIPYYYVMEVSDIYYAAIDGDDYFPDLFYSRFPVRNATQLGNLVDKTLWYELGEWEQSNDFLAATFMASEDNSSITEGTHEYCIGTYLDDRGFTSNRRYNGDGATAEEVTADIEGGLNYLIYSGHGSNTYWADGPAYYAEDVTALTNTAYPFVASHACLTGSYQDDECFSETWVRDDHGAVVMWAATTYTQWDEDDILQRRYFDGMFDTSLARNYHTIGEFSIYGMTKLYENYAGGGNTQEYYEKYNIMGDASIDLWTGQPTEMSVAHLPIIYFGSTSFTVNVIGEEGALVGLSTNGEFVAAALTDGGGAANLSWDDPIASAGTYQVTVTKHDRLPYQADVIAASASSDGMLIVSPAVVGDGMNVNIMVADADLAGNGSMTVSVTSDTETTAETVTLTEVGSDTGAFTGMIATNAGIAVHGNGTIEISEDDTITVLYHDAYNGSGPEDKTETIDTDLTAPTFAGITGAVPGDGEVKLSWSAATEPNTPVTYYIYRAETSGGQNFGAPLAQTKALTYNDNSVVNSTTYYYVVRAADRFGNQDENVVEEAATPEGPQMIFEEDWESDSVADWVITNGGGAADTWTTVDSCDECGSDLFSGTYMMADSNCAGSGIIMNEQLDSPTIDCSGYRDVFVEFANNVYHMGEQNCVLFVSVDNGTWMQVGQWRADTEEITSVDLSEYADGESNVRLRFSYYGIYDWWWAIDNIQVKGWEGGAVDDDTTDDDTTDDDTTDDDTTDDDTTDDDTIDDDTTDDDISDDDISDDDISDDDISDDDLDDDDTVDDDDNVTAPDDDTVSGSDSEDDESGCGC